MFGSSKSVQQVAALPFRQGDAEFELLLVTARSKGARAGRWIMPKGWPEGGETLAEAAACEALEEAGVEGRVHPAPIGQYSYRKAMPKGYEVDSQVFVFALHVHDVRDKWRERKQRKRRWFSLEAAAEALGDRDAARLVERLDAAALQDLLARLTAGACSDPASR